MKDKRCCGPVSAKYVVVAILAAVAAVIAYQALTGGSGTAEVYTGDSLTGDENVRVVMYSDFKCPYCARAADTVEILRQNYEGRVEFVFKHYPLSFHRGADKAAEAAECARDQGRFWEYHDRLFDLAGNGVDVGSTGVVKDAAAELGLDAEAFNQCLDSGSKRELVQQNIREGGQLGVTGTPTFFIEGQKVVGAQPYNVFSDIIDSKLEGEG